jgi:[ribosomal protein S18]-alanine N-acetyltransferase
VKVRLAAIFTLDRGIYNGAVPFRIRDFQPGDFDRLWQIDQECFPPGISYSRQELKSYMRRKGSFTLVAERDRAPSVAAGEDEGRNSEIQGCQIQGFIVTYGGSTGHIITIDVLAPARRAGLGSQLLAAAEDRLCAGGSRGVGLETAVDNSAAIAFYKRHGYSVTATWPRYYSNGVDALVMTKRL